MRVGVELIDLEEVYGENRENPLRFVPRMHFTEERFFRALMAAGFSFRASIKDVIEKGGFTLPFTVSEKSGKKLDVDSDQLLNYSYGTTKVRTKKNYPPDAILLREKGVKGIEIKKKSPQSAGPYRALRGLFPVGRVLGRLSHREVQKHLENALSHQYDVRAGPPQGLDKRLKEGKSLEPRDWSYLFNLAYQTETRETENVKRFVEDAVNIRRKMVEPYKFTLFSLAPLTHEWHLLKNVNRKAKQKGTPKINGVNQKWGKLILFERNVAEKLAHGVVEPSKPAVHWAKWYLQNVENYEGGREKFPLYDPRTIKHLKTFLSRE